MDNMEKINSNAGNYSREAFVQDSATLYPEAIQVVAASGVSGTLQQYSASTPYGAGQFVDLGILQTNEAQPTVVIVWYDTVNRQLLMTYNTTPNNYNATSNGTSWSNNTWADNTRVIDTEGGQYVKMAIDSDGGLHLAYYNNNAGDLKYAYLQNYNAEPEIVIVDSYLAVGSKCSIDVAKHNGNQVPYIGYQMNALTGTPASAKYAYRVQYETGEPVPAGTTSNDQFTGAWEITNVPTNRTPIDNKINIGVHKTWNGTERGTQLVIPSGTDVTEGETNQFPVSDSTIIYGNGTFNPALAYAVEENGVLEMAQKK